MLRRRAAAALAAAAACALAIAVGVWRLPREAAVVDGPQPAWTPVPATYIVRFTHYAPQADHAAAAAAVLAASVPRRGWTWRARDNPAAAHPTDFGVMTLTAAAKAALLAAPFVRDIHPERKLTRALAWVPGADEAAGGEEGGGGAPAGANRTTACALCVDDRGSVIKRPGRLTTPFSFAEQSPAASRRLLAPPPSVADAVGAPPLWATGATGAAVRVGIFDTGVKGDHPHIRHVVERSNWTHEPTLDDGLGHGSFVAGVVGGSGDGCPGVAPDVDLHTFRVFTNDQVSFTSWFLDAFNYAIATRMHVVNLSIGGPDWLDAPFVDKVLEVTSAGIIMISAIGNDGPNWGTLNNPGDAADVIGVGGIDYSDAVAPFSSRGYTTWELPGGAGRVKPDVVTYGKDVLGSRIDGGCRPLSGTSVAAPVVAGAVCLLASTLPPAARWHADGGVLNPASMKQALVEGADRLAGVRSAEQGGGKLNVTRSAEILKAYTPRASAFPPIIDHTAAACPYAWPHCGVPLYATAMPRIVNVTLLNGLGVSGRVVGAPTFTPADAGGALLDVRTAVPADLWPWSGHLGVYLRVKPEGVAFTGRASGNITLTVASDGDAAHGPRESRVVIPVSVDIAPPPPRAKRVLWDQWRSVRYPPSYMPRDSLEIRHDVLDWHGDHPHTNYHAALDALRAAGYSVELLGSPATCFNASLYGALLVADPENEYAAAEVDKLAADVRERGLGLVVFADWFNDGVAASLRFFDDNTRSWWTPPTGGANVPALNDLLAPLGAALGDAVLEGRLSGYAPSSFAYASGANIVRFPAGGVLHDAVLEDKAEGGGARAPRAGPDRHAVLGVAPVGAGALALYGDSGCVDTSHQAGDCYDLLVKLVAYAASGGRDAADLMSRGDALKQDWTLPGASLPTRRTGLPPAEALSFTAVTDRTAPPPACGPDAPLAFWGGDGVAAASAVDAAADAAPVKTPAPTVAAASSEESGGASTSTTTAPAAPVPRRSSSALPDATSAAAHHHAAPRPTPPPLTPSTTSAVASHLLSSPPALAGLGALAVGGVWASRSRSRRRAAEAAETLPRDAEGVEMLRGRGGGRGGAHME